ncbi:uncharacterized protein FIBRA_07846 [Fibroporia radiculosa]|uniref:Yeast cell wall synthesis Kre9/Knh1-like N-terminal domain-containing protein n=1 Tax=Fibroporia radiculosa TaxID=599839 RepID=J4I1H6_9APHY|nr:uncharacterized protein FIBRA_07846 [Fibroporia radiculosa]CCM05617.1 predicted protein [Fibroporia radiculosa]
MLAGVALAIALCAVLIPPTYAGVYVTYPVQDTVWQAGQNQTISWKDDGVPPSLQDFGNSKVSIYSGNEQQQTSMQEIVSSVNVYTTASILFTPNPAAGPSGSYFIRFESLKLRDANNSAYPAEAFSSPFTITGMNGSLSTLQAIAGAPNSSTSTNAATNPSNVPMPTPRASVPMRVSATTNPSPSAAGLNGQAVNSASLPRIGRWEGVGGITLVLLVGALL